VATHGNDFIDRAASAVRRYRNFGPDNDPYGEHDFGSFDFDGTTLNWKFIGGLRWRRLDARYQLPKLILRVKFIDWFGEKLRAGGADSRMRFELTR
jgi:hypothetical protein